MLRRKRKLRELFFPIDLFHWRTRDPIEYPGELVNNLSESDSDRKLDPEVEYHCVNANLEWGGELFERDDSGIDHYVMSDEDEIEFKSDSERVDGVISMNVDLLPLPLFPDD